LGEVANPVNRGAAAACWLGLSGQCDIVAVGDDRHHAVDQFDEDPHPTRPLETVESAD
jgi:hypothetical protein